jgi:hypothetical protein
VAVVKHNYVASGDTHLIFEEGGNGACGVMMPFNVTMRPKQVTCKACTDSPGHSRLMAETEFCPRHPEIEIRRGVCAACASEEAQYRFKRSNQKKRHEEHAAMITEYDPNEDQEGGVPDVEDGWDPFADPMERPAEIEEAAKATFPEAKVPQRRGLRDAPEIFLASAAAVRAARKGNATPATASAVGPGDAWTIMLQPNLERGEMGRGRVWQLTPLEKAVDGRRISAVDLDAYRSIYLNEPGYSHLGPREPLPPGPRNATAAMFDRGSRGHRLALGQLLGLSSGHVYAIQAGDTLMCSCSRKDAEAGKCHRAWAAYLLHHAGWRVILDGVEIRSDAEADALVEKVLK